MIQVQYQITLDDYQEAWKPHFDKRRSRLPLWVVAVFALAMSASLLMRSDLFGALLSGWISVFFAATAAMLLFASFLQKRNVSAAWVGNPFLARPQTATATTDAFRLQTEYS